MKLHFKGSLSLEMIKKITIGAFLLVGVFIAVGVSWAKEYLLLISAISLALIIYDLDLSKRTIGQENMRLNLSIALVGSLMQALTSITNFGIILPLIITVLYAIVYPLILSMFLWNKLDWNSENLKYAYNKALKKEMKADPKLMMKKVIIWKRKKLTTLDYIKVLVLFSLILEAFFIAVIISFLVVILGHLYVLEYSMFALFILWGFSTSVGVLPPKWRNIFRRSEMQERKMWTLISLSFLTLRGMYYLALFIASMFFACLGVFLLGLFFFGGIYGVLTSFQGSLPSAALLTQAILVWFSALALITYFVFPIYLVAKLYEALVLKLQKGKKEQYSQVKLLPLPSLCLLFSIILAYIIGFSIYVYDIISTLLYAMMAMAWIIWLSVFWLRHRGYHSTINRKTENVLALGLGIYSVPFYSFIKEIFVLVPLLLGTIFFLFRWLSSLEGKLSEKEEKKMVYFGLCFFGIIAIYFLIHVEFRLFAFFPILEIFLLLVLTLPKTYREKIIEKIMEKLFYIQEVEVSVAQEK